jgi:hypothetical protein
MCRCGYLSASHTRRILYKIFDHQLVRQCPLLPGYREKLQLSPPKVVRHQPHWEAGQEVMFISKGKGVLIMPLIELGDWAGFAEGAEKEDYPDREDPC